MALTLNDRTALEELIAPMTRADMSGLMEILDTSDKAKDFASGSLRGLPDSAALDRLRIPMDRGYGSFYAPFDWVNKQADVMLVGLTPGPAQARIAWQSFIAAMQAGCGVEEASRQAKQAAAFQNPGGQMRRTIAEQMDHFGMNGLLGIESCEDLFDKAATRAHYTSVLRHPVWKDKGGSMSGEEIMRSARLREIVDQYMTKELVLAPDAWVVTLGKEVDLVIDDLVQRGRLSRDRVLSGLKNPSSQQKNRHNCLLGKVDHRTCHRMVGCADVQARSEALHRKVAEAIDKGLGMDLDPRSAPRSAA